MRLFADLQDFDAAVTAFVGDPDASGWNEFWVQVLYHPQSAEADAKLYGRGEHPPAEHWRIVAAPLDRLSAAIADKYGTDGNFRLIRALQHWRIVYGPCWYYGGGGMPLARFIADETAEIDRLPDDWQPMTAEEIIEMMTET